MVTLGLRPEVEERNQALGEKVTWQVAEIMETAEIEEEPVQETSPAIPTWKYSMPFAGVRYFSYD
jgi:hypothetical protein